MSYTLNSRRKLASLVGFALLLVVLLAAAGGLDWAVGRHQTTREQALVVLTEAAVTPIQASVSGRVWVDGELVVDDWREGEAHEMTADLWRPAGNHALRIEYLEQAVDAFIQVWWEEAVSSTPAGGASIDRTGHKVIAGAGRRP